MTSQTTVIVVTLSLVLGGFVNAAPSPERGVDLLPEAGGSAFVVPSQKKDWVAKKDNNICGIADLKKVSNPAKVDYSDLLSATPDMKRMKKEKIDPDSREGRALRNSAISFLTKKCEEVRSAKGHCGIWKAIRNKDGRIVPDVTKDVKAKF